MLNDVQLAQHAITSP